jgi:hypothetical protein
MTKLPNAVDGRTLEKPDNGLPFSLRMLAKFAVEAAVKGEQTTAVPSVAIEGDFDRVERSQLLYDESNRQNASAALCALEALPREERHRRFDQAFLGARDLAKGRDIFEAARRECPADLDCIYDELWQEELKRLLKASSI